MAFLSCGAPVTYSRWRSLENNNDWRNILYNEPQDAKKLSPKGASAPSIPKYHRVYRFGIKLPSLLISSHRILVLKCYQVKAEGLEDANYWRFEVFVSIIKVLYQRA
jgi:hypothetical protein